MLSSAEGGCIVTVIAKINKVELIGGKDNGPKSGYCIGANPYFLTCTLK